MIHPVLKVDEQYDTSNGYFYDHLHNQIYLVKEGRLLKRSIQQGSSLVNVPFTVHSHQNNQKLFPTLTKDKGQCKFNLQKTSFTTQVDSQSTVRTDIEINDGSVWSWFVPGTLKHVRLGVVQITKNNNIFETYVDIVASSSRTVTFAWLNGQLKTWVNGKAPSRDHIKELKVVPQRQSKFYGLASCYEKGRTLIFNPFATLPNQENSLKFNNHAKIQPTQQKIGNDKLKKITQLNKDKLLLVTQNEWIKIIHRNSITNKFDFPSVQFSSEGKISGIFTPENLDILSKDNFIKDIWESIKSQADLNIEQIKMLLEKSINFILAKGVSNQTKAYRILIEKVCILRSLDSSFNLSNLIYESEFDREFYSQTSNNQYFDLPKTSSNNIAKSVILNQSGWTKIEGKISDITQNYILAIEEETVVIYHIGDIVKKVFMQNIVFFEFNKSSFLERYNENDLRILKKGEKTSSIYKLLANCFSKDKKSLTQVFPVKESDLKQLINDYRISEADAKLSLEQTGDVEDALVWLSRPESQRIYIEKHDELKHKSNDQQPVSGSLLQLNFSPLSRLLLKVNNQIYLLGYDPSNLNNNLSKGEKQFVNLFDFKRQSNIEQIDAFHWFNSQNHQLFSIIDSLTLKEKSDFLFKEADQIYICKNQAGSLSKALITLNTKSLFENQSSLQLGASQIIEGDTLTRDISGQIFYSSNIATTISNNDHIFVHNGELHTNLRQKTNDVIEIQVTAQDASFEIGLNYQNQHSQNHIPLLIENGPPGCNSHYEISSILNPGSSFLANYSQQIKLKNQHSKFMKVTSVTLERQFKKLTTNELKEGWIYFQNDANIKSKKYHFKFNEKESRKEITIEQNGYWKYIVLLPVFNNGKKMPFEFGFIGAKGFIIENQIYQQLLSETIKSSLLINLNKNSKNVSYEVENVQQTSNNVLKLTLKPSEFSELFNVQIKSPLQTVLSINSKKVIKPQMSQQEEQASQLLKNISKLNPQQVMKLLFKSQLQKKIMKQFAQNKGLDFKAWESDSLRKFIDLTFLKSSILKSGLFEKLFDKILQNKEGKKYIDQLCHDIGKCYITFPENHLFYLIKKINSNQHKQNLKDLLQQIPKVRSDQYKDMRKQNIPYLLLEQNFYSRYYLDQIQKIQSNNSQTLVEEKTPIFGQQSFIPAEFVVLRDEISRKIYVKLESQSNVNSIVLRFDRTQLTSRVNYKIYSLQEQRELLQKGTILENQWTQFTKLSQQEHFKQLLKNNSTSLNAFSIELNQPAKTELLQIQILYSETGISAKQTDSKSYPFIDIIPEVYGEAITSTQSSSSIKSFSQVHKYFDFKEQEGFYLSSLDIGLVPVEKFSISKENQYQYSYFKQSVQKIEILRKNIAERIQKRDYLGAIPDHKKLVGTYERHSKKPNLDYVYTLLMLTFEQIFNNKVILGEQLSKAVFQNIIEEATGPIRISAFKAFSGSVHYLIKSLPFIEQEGYMPNLQKVAFQFNEIQQTLDLKNLPLCNSLNKLVVNSIPYEHEWAKFLIKINPMTQKYQENIKYIVKSNQDWYLLHEVLTFFNEVPQNHFVNVLLTNIDGPTLEKYILESKRNNKTSRIHLLVNKLIQIYNGKIDLDIVSMMLEEKDIKWHNLYKIIKICPQAEDFILTQFLQIGQQNPDKLAEAFPEIVNQCAKSVKHSQNFASFLRKLFQKNRSSFKKSILNLSQDIVPLHSDMVQVLAFYLYEECNFGGVQGCKLLKESQLFSIYVAQILLKKINFTPADEVDLKQINDQEVLIEWYFCNNSYEHVSMNPANKSPGIQLIKSLSERVLQLIQNRPIEKILKVFDRIIKEIQIQTIPLSTKHIYINQINEGISQLLGKSINPNSLSQILVGGQNNQMLKRIFESLALLNQKSANASNSSQQQNSWTNSREIDFIQKFGSSTNIKDKVKDWESNRSGSKTALFKVPCNEGRILLKSSDLEGHILSKVLIGFNNAENAQKNNIYPYELQLYGGENENSLIKICDLKQIHDQNFESFNTRVYGINFNSLPFRKCVSPIQSIQIKIVQPLLPSVSDIFQSSQKIKKDAFYSVSFISLMGYESQPKTEPAYNQIYMTLLSFLSDQKYGDTLQKVIQSGFYKQKSGYILKLLNSLLPNKEIESLLLALNKQNQDVLGSILQNKRPNIQLIQLLMQANPSGENITKLLKYFMSNHSQKLTDIIITSIKLFSYQNPKEKINIIVDDLLKNYQSTGFKNSVFSVLSAILSSPSAFNFDYKTLVDNIWKKTESGRAGYYKVIGATIGYYNETLNEFLTSGKTLEIVNELTTLLSSRNPAIHNQIYLLSQLALHVSNRQYLIDNQIPIKLVNLLRNEETLIVKEYGTSMQYFILLFQSTCIQSACEDKFSEILIELMVKLPQVAAAHHNLFIHQFFFPLINAFKGIPIKFVWRNSAGKFLAQATHSLKTRPIKSSQEIIVVDGLYLEKTSFNDWSSVNDRSQYVVLNSHQIINNSTAELSDKPECLNKLYKIVNDDISQLLTNQTLIKLNNLGIFGSNYMNNVPVQDSTSQNVYYLPCEMTLNDVLKQVNLCGYRLNEETIQQTQFKDRKIQGQTTYNKTKPIEDILPQSQKHFAVLEINPESFFSNTSIDQIAKNAIQPPIFIPQQTIFKAFQKKQGLMKMITVLKTCVKNWNNPQQSKIWQQYLNELESYSCFPVFSSIYMNKQENVQLLFDILSGLPDKQDSKKWIELEKTSVKFLYSIIKDVFEVEGQKALQIRKYAVQNGFYKTMLERLHLVSKQPKRVKVQEEQEEQLVVPTNIRKMTSDDDYKLKVVKKKGIGYGTDSSTNQKWDIVGQYESRKELSNQILDLLKILEKFLDHKMFEPSKQIVDQSYQSALLPIIESSLRGGSLLEISKSADLFRGQLSFIKALTKKKPLIPILLAIPKCYEPNQHQSVFQLLKVLESTSKIFLTCLTGSVGQKLSEEIAKEIIETYELVELAVSNYQLDHVDEDEEKKILQLPLSKKYPLLLKDLRFDYVDMKDKNGKITKHHYNSNFAPNHKAPPAKTIRLAQQLADISHALPVEHTNAIYVRCDKERVDFMQALIMGSNGTPYGHGAYLFDIYFDDTYPNNPPKVNLTTTGNGQIRFNPNLYSCGKVCLSLLGTWRGSAMQNWDPKVSTLLQILVSIQSIIMSEEVYFNEPGFQHQQGTIEGQKKNEAYANIVRYGNVKFAMLENIKNPPKGFEHIIKRHFYLKKDEIMAETKKWLKYAEKREASYTGLVSDHNNNWSNTFKKSKTEYKTMLQKAIKQLQQELNKLPQPSHKDLQPSLSLAKKEKKKQVKIQSKDENIEDVDVTYDKTDQNNNLKELDINDEKVKDRWSRYIGAMGIEAVSKQSKASIILFGLGATGVQIAKNIILSGCKKISIVDETNTTITDLSGQFFLGEQDVGKNRVDACLYKLQELNHYVRVENLKFSADNLEVLKQYDVVILTEQSLATQKTINAFCHQNAIKFIITDCYGPFGQHFNDFGNDFEVLDKNGEETVQVMIESITSNEKGIVTLLNKQRHPYQDGQAVRITGVKGMTKENGESINGTIHKIRVINQFSFQIGNTTEYSPYEVDGLARNMKIPIKVEFKPFEESIKLCNIDNNLSFYDFEKSTKNTVLHQCFLTLSNFRQKNNKHPQPWNWEDGETFLSMLKELYTEELKAPEINFIRTFAYTCSGNFAPLAAFYGGLTAQEAFKAITGKYMPINQYFFIEFTEVVPSLPQKDEDIQKLLQQINYKESQHRNQGIRRVVGNQLIEAIEKCRLFLIGSGAIGCQLLKNYAMINLATSKDGGEIVVTDPDHIQESNLNRQFLFRQKHLRKPKSVTAAAAVAQMNKLLKGKIRAKLDRVCQTSKDIFSNQFFESLNVVTNALDNVKARQYVDQRCVQNKVALLESGTLSSKGHVQVILPYLTETYGSKNDPAEEGEIPHCTLKMFPQQTLHCVEWARDIFGKTFTLDPKALSKLLEKWKDFTPTASDLEMLKSCSKLLEKKPKNFEQAIYIAVNKFFELYRNDIMQLLYTYPLDAKTKDGKPFWKLPKRPPTPVQEIDPSNELHTTFITSYAVLLCKIFNVEHPKDFRKAERKQQIINEAAKIKVEPFIPNDKLAKQMADEVEKNQNAEDKQTLEETIDKAENEVTLDENTVFENIRKVVEQSKNEIKVTAEEFEKDDDQNGHIDLIYSMANLRASNYKLQPMDWMTTKLKAGRITPALSTTTSCVAALQTIELIKYLKKCKLDKMRNTFINLAVPMIQAGQPGEAEKIKIHQNLTTNIWERWEVGPFDLDKITLGELLSSIQEKYKIQVKILNILEGAQIYSELVFGLQSKKHQKEEYLKKSLKEVLLSEISSQDLKKFVDLSLVFAINDQLAKHVPTIRLKLNE